MHVQTFVLGNIPFHLVGRKLGEATRWKQLKQTYQTKFVCTPSKRVRSLKVNSTQIEHTIYPSWNAPICIRFRSETGRGSFSLIRTILTDWIFSLTETFLSVRFVPVSTDVTKAIHIGEGVDRRRSAGLETPLFQKAQQFIRLRDLPVKRNKSFPATFLINLFFGLSERR